MLYAKNEDLPGSVRALPDAKQTLWRTAHNDAAEKGGGKKAARRAAWNKVRDAATPDTDNDDDERTLEGTQLDPEFWKDDYSTSERAEMAKKGEAMPDGSYPIKTAADLSKAVKAVGRGKNNSHAAIRRHIEKRAKTLGATSSLPASWSDAIVAPFLFVDDGCALLDGGTRRTSDRYLVADARVARTGVQIYHGKELGRPDLERVRVYRPPEEVFSRDSMRSMAHRPVTLQHPPVMVDAGNWKKFARGQTGEDVVRDGDCVRVPMVIMDHDAIAAYDRGVRQLSMGYTADIEWRKGTTDSGEQFDAVQTGIRANHLAIVPVARGGSSLRIGDDKGVKKMKVLTIDNAPIEFVDEISAAHVQNHVTKLLGTMDEIQGKLAKSKADRKEVSEASERALADAATKTADLQKQLDAKSGEVAALTQQLKDAVAKSAPEFLDSLVKARADVIDRAATLVDQAYDFAGKSIEDIRRAAVAKKLGEGAVKEMNDGVVEGAFFALTANHTPRTGTSVLRDALSIHRPHSVTVQDARAEALASRDQGLQNAWKTPQRAAN